MTRDEVLDHFRDAGALLEGHFLLTSGLHSPVYLQAARVLMDTKRAETLCKALAAQVTTAFGPDAADLVVSPAMGGILAGYELARHLALPSLFAERVDGVFRLRRGFEITKGARVIMAEDIVTTGKSSRECIACIAANGGRTVAATCLIDRSDGAADLGVPLIALAGFDVPTFPGDALPPELAALPAVKPGSRGLD